MADMSKLMHPTHEDSDPALRETDRLISEQELTRQRILNDKVVDSMRENITLEGAFSLKDRLVDAEQLWRYFCRRDEMNAEVHLALGEPNVRYSPISIAAERVAGYLAALYYGRDVDYLTTMVESGGAPLSVPYTYHRQPQR